MYRKLSTATSILWDGSTALRSLPGSFCCVTLTMRNHVSNVTGKLEVVSTSGVY